MNIENEIDEAVSTAVLAAYEVGPDENHRAAYRRGAQHAGELAKAMILTCLPTEGEKPTRSEVFDLLKKFEHECISAAQMPFLDNNARNVTRHQIADLILGPTKPKDNG